ncbi:MAG: HEPN domain-containing protein [Methanomicrobium sp.]|nr:HEPN domain-containing protein [Methanomicrobium sp.]
MSEIEWCKDQKKGIRLIEPNENLSAAYFKKAEEALETMNSIDSPDWIVSIGYYCMYYSFYAVMMKAGIKSEIHTCTIECMKECFSKFFGNGDVKMIEDARVMRVQSQYSVSREFAREQAGEIVSNAPIFLLKCRNICSRMTRADITKIRSRIE